LTGEQWLGVLTLGVLALGTMFAIKYLQPTEETTIVVSDSAKTAFEQHQTQQDKKYQRDTIEIRLHEFNPNTADSSTLVHLGFQPWQAKNMLKYSNETIKEIVYKLNFPNQSVFYKFFKARTGMTPSEYRNS
jgi:hypothetical protein